MTAKWFLLETEVISYSKLAQHHSNEVTETRSSRRRIEFSLQITIFFFFFLNFWIFGGWKSHAHWHSSQMHTNTYDFIIWANCIKIDFIYDDFDRENSVSTFKSIELISFTNATTILLTSIDAMRVTIECCTIECCELLSVSVRLCNSRSRTKKKINMIC